MNTVGPLPQNLTSGFEFPKKLTQNNIVNNNTAVSQFLSFSCVAHKSKKIVVEFA